MHKAYLLIYDDTVGTRETIKNALNSMERVHTWRFDIPHCFYVISEFSAEDLYKEFAKINGTNGRYMFIEAGTNRQGQMLPDTWYLLRNKTHKSKD